MDRMNRRGVIGKISGGGDFHVWTRKLSIIGHPLAVINGNQLLLKTVSPMPATRFSVEFTEQTGSFRGV